MKPWALSVTRVNWDLFEGFDSRCLEINFSRIRVMIQATTTASRSLIRVRIQAFKDLGKAMRLVK